MRELLQQITDLAEELSRTKAQLDRLAVEARLGGCTWTSIGNALGMTKQAAQRRFSPFLTEPPPSESQELPGQQQLPVDEPDEPPCPNCPLCSSPAPFIFPNLRNAFCVNEDCDVLTWDPWATLEQNLTNAGKARYFIDGVEQEDGL